MVWELLTGIRTSLRRLAVAAMPAKSSVTTDQTDANLFFDRISEYDYNHYYRALGDIAELKQAERYSEAEALLLWCIEYAEAEQLEVEDIDGWGELPAVLYQELADLYRQTGRVDRAQEVLERYVTNQRRIGAPIDSDIADMHNTNATLNCGI